MAHPPSPYDEHGKIRKPPPVLTKCPRCDNVYAVKMPPVEPPNQSIRDIDNPAMIGLGILCVILLLGLLIQIGNC